MLEKPAVTRGAAFLAVKSQESSQVSGKILIPYPKAPSNRTNPCGDPNKSLEIAF
jgi:hypothetical protein